MHKRKQYISHMGSKWHKELVCSVVMLTLAAVMQPAYAINEEVMQREHMAAMGLGEVHCPLQDPESILTPNMK